MKLNVNTLLNNRYSIIGFLSQGGFGYTYLAEDNLSKDKVCVKELFISGISTRGSNLQVISENSNEFSFEYFSERFWEEAQQLAQFNHPNIVKVKDFFRANGTTYIVMEFIEGETLQSFKIKGGLNNFSSIYEAMHQLLDAIETVHKAGMLHRDIKPENILITPENKIVLIDFGSARDFEDGKTKAHTTLLTPGYAPIEQYSNRAKRGPYTDIYALGATLYFLLTGEKPLAATDRHLERLTPPHLINNAVSTQLSSAVMMAMEMNPEDRFQSIAEMRDALNILANMSNKTIFFEKKLNKGQTNFEKKHKTPSLKINFKNLVIFLIVFIGIIFFFNNFIFVPQKLVSDEVKKENYSDASNEKEGESKEEKKKKMEENVNENIDGVGKIWDEKKAKEIVLRKLNEFGSFKEYGFQKDNNDFLVHKIIDFYLVAHINKSSYYCLTYSKPSKLEAHAFAPKISVFEFNKSKNEWILSKSFIAEIEAGSWGNPPENLKVLQIGYNIFGIVIEHGFTNQGVIMSYTVIHSLIGDKLKEIFKAETMMDDEAYQGEPMNSWTSKIKFNMVGTSFYDLKIIKTGKFEGEKMTKTELYKFDGKKYSQSELYE
jgi:serine/threonine protein kinase